MRIGIVLAAALLAGGCSGGGHAAASARHPSPPVATAEGSGGCAAPRVPAPPRPRPRYRLALSIEPARRLVEGRLAVRFVPSRGIDRLVFRLWPNGPLQAREGASLRAGPVTVSGAPARSSLPDPTTLVVRLARRVRAGGEVAAALPFRLRLPGPVVDRLAVEHGSVRLGSFFPLLAWDPRSGWVRDPPARVLGEASTSPVADFDLTIRAPHGLAVVASGRPLGGGRFRARAVRDVAVAVGRFHLLHATVRAPAPVRVTVAADRSLGRRPARALLRRVRRALPALAALYGRYPWSYYSDVLMADLGPLGTEYPTLVFEGPQGITRTTAHETAHQWFYSLVGNDQYRDPWLDEALATWASGRVDGTTQRFARYPVPRAVRGRLEAPMSFWARHARDYFEGAYAQGVRALAAVAAPARVDCALRRYAAAAAWTIARPPQLAGALQGVSPRARSVLRRYGARTAR